MEYGYYGEVQYDYEPPEYDEPSGGEQDPERWPLCGSAVMNTGVATDGDGEWYNGLLCHNCGWTGRTDQRYFDFFGKEHATMDEWEHADMAIYGDIMQAFEHAFFGCASTREAYRLASRLYRINRQWYILPTVWRLWVRRFDEAGWYRVFLLAGEHQTGEKAQ